MNPSIEQRIAPIVLTPHTLLTPVTKEFVADTVSGGVWVNVTPQKVIRMGVNGSIPGENFHAVSVFESPSPVLIGIVATSPPCGLNTSQQVANKRNPLPPYWSGTPQNWTLSLTETCPMTWILRQFSAK